MRKECNCQKNKSICYCNNCDKYLCEKCIEEHTTHFLFDFRKDKKGKWHQKAVTSGAGGAGGRNQGIFDWENFRNRRSSCLQSGCGGAYHGTSSGIWIAKG